MNKRVGVVFVLARVFTLVCEVEAQVPLCPPVCRRCGVLKYQSGRA
jgi:hypothetical protein